MQTFYLAQSGPNLVFHADNAQRVYIQSRSLFLTGDGTIASASSMGAGTVYTVVSDDVTATPEQLRQSTLSQPSSPVPQADGLPRSDTERYLQLPHAYPQGGGAGPADHRRDRVTGQPGHLRQGQRPRVVDVHARPVHAPTSPHWPRGRTP